MRRTPHGRMVIGAALIALLGASGCASVRRALGLVPAGGQPVELPTAAFFGADRLLTAPGEPDGELERIVFPASGASATVAPGDSVVLLDLTGPTVVRRLRISLASADPHWLRRIGLRMHWEGETEPSLHVPLGDFFGNGFEQRPYAALPMGVAGDAFYSYLPLPFARHGRIVLENGTELPIEELAFDADVETGAGLAEPVATFHALWSRDPRPRPDRRHVAADVEGAGWLVGMALSAQGYEGSFAFLGGEGLLRVDGRALDPSAVASYLGAPADGGSELAGPFQGVLLQDSARARLAAYRWHIADPIPFRSSFRLELERGPSNREGADYATVAYWYQTEPHAPLPSLPGPHERRVAEVLVPPGAVHGDELRVIGTGASTARVSIPVPRPDRYEVVVYPEASPGVVSPQVSVPGSARPGRALEVSPPGAEPGDVLPGVVVDTVAVTARALELALAAPGGGIALPAAVQLRSLNDWMVQWWAIGSWPNADVTDPALALRTIWGPDREPELDRSHPLPGGDAAEWTRLDASAHGWLEVAPRGGTVYAQAFLYAPRERGVVLVVESDGAHEVRVGGSPALPRSPRAAAEPPGVQPGEVELDAYLRAGWNRVLVKLAAVGQGRFRMRAADPEGGLIWARTP